MAEQTNCGHHSESTAGLTAPVRQFILVVATDPVVGAQDDILAFNTLRSKLIQRYWAKPCRQRQEL